MTAFEIPGLPDDDNLSESMRYALGVVESMGSHGLTAVPVKPTMEMLLAGARAGDISVEAAWTVYTAMLKASE
ncbi:hypothetical protein [Indioceanicola profundi]|uniref:hypothetical protein n=1 Tax=Indioceanicola profundi TaxID=2220096 RepID=UPI000E6AC949|nr:hypothetical protein [Indioceanicola profundi]